jgi:hypothetical protein
MILPETNITVGIRFSFFAMQLVAFLWMAVIIDTAA